MSGPADRVRARSDEGDQGPSRWTYREGSDYLMGDRALLRIFRLRLILKDSAADPAEDPSRSEGDAAERDAGGR